jgi:hypothetical protein
LPFPESRFREEAAACRLTWATTTPAGCRSCSHFSCCCSSLSFDAHAHGDGSSSHPSSSTNYNSAAAQWARPAPSNRGAYCRNTKQGPPTRREVSAILEQQGHICSTGGNEKGGERTVGYSSSSLSLDHGFIARGAPLLRVWTLTMGRQTPDRKTLYECWGNS